MAKLQSNQPINPLWSESQLKQWGKGMYQDIAAVRKARMAAYSQSGIIANTMGGRAKLGLMGLRRLLFRR